MHSLKESIDPNKLPSHVAVIMDGNGRWAKNQGKNRVFGHNHGVTAVRNTSEACAELGVDFLTLFAFSSENWSRPSDEVSALMDLLVETIKNEINTLNENNISLTAIGNLDHLPSKCYLELNEAISATQNNTGLTLNLALNYSGRWDLKNAFQKIGAAIYEGELNTASITEDTIKNHLTTHHLPDPSLLIRTSGEQRISNFLLWELAYTELYFCSKNWPEFTKEDFYQAIVDYQNRERRFGMVSEQIG